MFALASVFALLASSASAFTAPRVARSSSALRMSAEDMVGSLPPVGFFDPLNLSEGKSDVEMKKIREAELKHGRVAMLAFLGIVSGEAVAKGETPFQEFFGGITGPAIYQFQQADEIFTHFWEVVLFGIAVVEGQNIISGWESIKEASGKTVSDLKEDYVNGDLGFDPLGLKPDAQDEFDVLRTKELQNGRLAMLGVAGIVAQELVTGQSIF